MRPSSNGQELSVEHLDAYRFKLTAVLERLTSGHPNEQVSAGFLTRQVLDALQRIDNDRYGRCLSCGQPIAPKRLEALPWVAFCILCQDEFRTREI
jgi:hypothetical protein